MSIHLVSTNISRDNLVALADLFQMHRGPSLVRIQIELTDHNPPLRLQARLTETRIRPSEQLVLATEQICGKGAVSWL